MTLGAEGMSSVRLFKERLALSSLSKGISSRTSLRLE